MGEAGLGGSAPRGDAQEEEGGEEVNSEQITEIGVDESGRIYVVPAETRFTHIYRAAAEVHWDNQLNRLHSPVPRQWSHLDWYQHIIAIAKDKYGVSLEQTAATQWHNVAPALKSEIESLT